MKRNALILIMLTIFSIMAVAQNSEKPRMSREELAEKQAKYIAHELAMDDATTQKFVTTYCAYQKELWALGPRVKENKDTEMTEAEAEQLIQARFERSQKILTIREKYYKEYSKFLTAKQIEQVYEIERQLMHRLSKSKREERK